MNGYQCLTGGLLLAGYTLLELLATVSISALMLTLAVPNLGNQVARQELAVHTREFRAALNVARSQALTRQKNVYICRRTAEGECDISPVHRAEWNNGWLVFVDENRNGRWDDTDFLLNETVKDGAGVRQFMNHRGRLRFFPDGSARSVGFWFCGWNGGSQYLALLRSGRSRLAQRDGGSGVPECGSDTPVRG